MKPHQFLIAVGFFVFCGCSSSKKLSTLDFCPGLDETVEEGWNVKGKKQEICCDEGFLKKFSEYMNTESCRVHLTKEHLQLRLGNPFKLTDGAYAVFKLTVEFNEKKQYETIQYQCVTERKYRTDASKYKNFLRNFYFVFEKESGKCVGFYETT